MKRREKRVIEAFLNCIEQGEYTVDYAIVLIEDRNSYGWLSNNAKDYFYEQLDIRFPEPEEEIPEEEIPEEEIPEEQEVWSGTVEGVY